MIISTSRCLWVDHIMNIDKENNNNNNNNNNLQPYKDFDPLMLWTGEDGAHEDICY